MMSSQFDPGLTLKILNLSILRFNERFGSENLVADFLPIFQQAHLMS